MKHPSAADAVVLALQILALNGVAVGADSAIATAYIAEFAPAGRRGQLSIIQQWMITIGILVSNLLALLVFKVAPSAAYGADWRIILGLGAVPALLALVLRARMPESPRWLMLQGRFADTRKALGQFWIEVSDEQVRQSAEQMTAAETKERKQHKSQWTPGG